MTDVAGPRSPGLRSTELKTKRDIATTFFKASSPRIIVIAASVAVTARLFLGQWSYGDVITVAGTLSLTGPVEWIIHLYLLHAPVDSFVTRRLGSGISHRKHHLDPPDIRWILLNGTDAAVFVAMLAVFTAAWSLPLLWLTGSAVALPYLTALAAAYLGLVNYEWTHLMAHSRYQPRTRLYARLARNHRLHHYRNERYWLGVTSNMGDRILRTLPRSKTDVPLSDTARTLE